MPNFDPLITPKKKCSDWRTLQAKLIAGGNPTLWREAANDYFFARLDSRYLTPIKILDEHGQQEGEGFSIVAIQCSLIEFLEATVEGKNYRYKGKNPSLGSFEYSNSGDLFVNFLTARSPFAQDFDKATATSFYKDVRCGLLHEAQTKNGWRIHATQASTVVDGSQKIVYRRVFQTALRKFIDQYMKDLQAEKDRQAAFIRKFHYICT
jgi:hypothetical protein